MGANEFELVKIGSSNVSEISKSKIRLNLWFFDSEVTVIDYEKFTEETFKKLRKHEDYPNLGKIVIISNKDLSLYHEIYNKAKQAQLTYFAILLNSDVKNENFKDKKIEEIKSMFPNTKQFDLTHPSNKMKRIGIK